MTSHQVKIVQQSWEKNKPVMQEAGDHSTVNYLKGHRKYGIFSRMMLQSRQAGLLICLLRSKQAG